jgi:flagellar protein FlbT
MALKLTLKADEKVIIDGAVIRNGNKSVEFFVENKVPILREKDIMPDGAADTPARHIYFTLQLIYIDAEKRAVHLQYFLNQANAFIDAVPAGKPYIDDICKQLEKNRFYQALKVARSLIDYEKEFESHE